jgi:hypothetical protein
MSMAAVQEIDVAMKEGLHVTMTQTAIFDQGISSVILPFVSLKAVNVEEYRMASDKF